MEDKTILIMYVITIVAALEAYAIHSGINGKMLATAMGVIFFLVGLFLTPPENIGGILGKLADKIPGVHT